MLRIKMSLIDQLESTILKILKHRQFFYNQQFSNQTTMDIQSFLIDTLPPLEYIFHYSNDQNSSLNHQYSWMDEYFNQEVLKEKLFLLPQSETSEVLPVLRKNKSVFHNFQKHLLTLLKKVIVVKKAELIPLPSGNRAYELWRIFLGLESYAKKNLYIIFGVAQRENEDSLKTAALQIPELQRMLNKHGISEMEAAQRLLRKVVSSQAAQIQREKLECECKMKKFEEFYCYFRGFVEELAEGGISRRMTKERKLRLIPLQERE